LVKTSRRRNTSYNHRMPRPRFILSLAIVSLGAALFAVAFRSALAFLYQHLYQQPNVVDAMRGLPWLLTVSGLLPIRTPGRFALVGMAATTASSIHAPLTAAVLVFELSGDYAIVLPLLLATAIATSASRTLGGISVYEAELRPTGRGWRVTLEGREVTNPAPSTLDKA